MFCSSEHNCSVSLLLLCHIAQTPNSNDKKKKNLMKMELILQQFQQEQLQQLQQQLQQEQLTQQTVTGIIAQKKKMSSFVYTRYCGKYSERL